MTDTTTQPENNTTQMRLSERLPFIDLKKSDLLFATKELIVGPSLNHGSNLSVSFKPDANYCHILNVNPEYLCQTPCLWVSKDVARGQLSASGISLSKTKEHTIPYYHADTIPD